MYDDGVAITQNGDVANTNQSIYDNIHSIVMHDFWGQDLSDDRSHKSYRPLVTLMFHLEYRYLNRTNLAAIMKRINLFIHIGICCIIYDILRRILHDCHQSVISTAVLLFAVHPIHTEAICSAVGRSDLLCAFFFFATIGQYLDIITGETIFHLMLTELLNQINQKMFLIMYSEHERNGSINWTKMIILFDAALICLLCKEVGIMVLVC